MSEKEFPQFLQDLDPLIYMSDNYVVLDMENGHYYSGFPDALNTKADVQCTVYGSKYNYKVTSCGEYTLYKKIKDAIYSADFIVAHNAKHELGWLQRAGFDISKLLVFDTMIAAYVIGGNRQEGIMCGLDKLAKRHGLPGKTSWVSKLIKAGVCPSEIPSKYLKSYCADDVRDTEAVFLLQRKELLAEGLLPAMFTRCIFTPVLTDIERNGMCLDKELVEAEYVKVEKEYQQLLRDLDDFTGGINPNSGKQVAEYLYDVLKFEELKTRRGEPKRTEKGARLTDSDTILKLRAKTKKQKEFIELKSRQGKLNAKLTKTLRPLHKAVTETDDNILYAAFLQTKTQTHRLSSNGKKFGVQFQNLPRSYKYLFTSRDPAWRVMEIDGAQLEFRVAAFLAQDKRAMQDIADGFDVHSYTASILFDVPLEEMLAQVAAGNVKYKELRTKAKSDTFKPLFGGQSGTEKQMAYYAAFKEKYPDIVAWQERNKNEVVLNKSLTTITGLKFYWNAQVDRGGYITYSTQICNYPVQSLSTADIIPIGVTYLWHRMRANNLKSFLVNTVHDSAIGEINLEEAELFEKIAVQSFIDDAYYYLKKVYGIDFNVELGAEIAFTTHWSKDIDENARNKLLTTEQIDGKD